jgi:uncharacterized protein (TIGR02266 family)
LRNTDSTSIPADEYSPLGDEDVIDEDQAAARAATLPADDRRAHARFALALAITLSGENNFYTGLTEDISEGGVFIATHHILPLGTPVIMAFTLPHARKPLQVAGKVRWIREPDAVRRPGYNFGGDLDRDVKPGMGVEFTNLDAESLAAIKFFTRCRAPEFFD